MYAIYSKGGETHVRLDVKTAGGIDGDDYFDMGHSLPSLCRSFKRDVGMPEKGNKIEVRSNVQSPGIFEFITQDPALAGFLACVLTVAVFGGHAKSEKFGISIGTDGLLKGISNFLMEGKKRQLLEDLRGNLGAMDASVATDAVLRLTGTSPSSPSAPPAVSQPPRGALAVENHAYLLKRTSFQTAGGNGIEIKYTALDARTGRRRVRYMRTLVVDSIGYNLIFRPANLSDSLGFMDYTQRRRFFNSVTVKP